MISETYSTVTKKDTIELPDGSLYSILSNRAWTSNLGKYVITKCSGNRLDNKGKLVEINVFANLKLMMVINIGQNLKGQQET